MPILKTPAAQICVGDVGTQLAVQVVDENGDIVNIAAATLMQITLLPPRGGIPLVVSAVLDTDGTDGVMRYTTLSGDLSAAGEWGIRGRVSVGAGTWNTPIANFWVYA